METDGQLAPGADGARATAQVVVSTAHKTKFRKRIFRLFPIIPSKREDVGEFDEEREARRALGRYHQVKLRVFLEGALLLFLF